MKIGYLDWGKVNLNVTVQAYGDKFTYWHYYIAIARWVSIGFVVQKPNKPPQLKAGEGVI